MRIIIYVFFYAGALLLGFFGIAPLIVNPSFDEKFPYMVVVIFGYSALIGLLVSAHQKGYMKHQIFRQNKGMEREAPAIHEMKPQEFNQGEETLDDHQEERGAKGEDIAEHLQ